MERCATSAACAPRLPRVARGTSPLDSKDRQRVIDIDVPVEIDGVTFTPGDLVVADEDGVVVIPRRVEEQFSTGRALKPKVKRRSRGSAQG